MIFYYKRAKTAGVSPQMKRIMKTGEAGTMRNKHCGCKPAVVYFYIGLFLIISGMLNSYAGIERLSDWTTPVCWWGYILAVDAIILKIKKRSVIKNNFRLFLYHIIFSVLFWLIFEVYNLHLKNWVYTGVPGSALETYAGMAFSFMTILPALFYTAELIHMSGIFGRIKFPKITVSSSLAWLFIVTGFAGLVIPLMLPQNTAGYMFITVWLGWIFMLEPVNFYSGTESILKDLTFQNGGRLMSLFASGAVCGFLWEFWNFWAGSKWEYTVPFQINVRIFEMPLLGFLGFLPFALEYFAAYHAARLVTGRLISGGKSLGYGIFD